MCVCDKGGCKIDAIDVSIVRSCHVYTGGSSLHGGNFQPCLLDRIPGQTNSLKHKVIVLNVLRCIGGMPEQSGSIYVRFISTKSFARPRQAVGPMQTHLGHNIFAHALLVIYVTFPKCCCLRNFVLRYQCVEKISTKCLEIFLHIGT